MHFAHFLDRANEMLVLPSTIIFFAVSIILTIKLDFLQLRSFRRFCRLITSGVEENAADKKTMRTISPFHALFTAMSTTIGIGNVVGPSIAILAGGPGALFWLVAYAFFASVTKYTEVTFALKTRKRDEQGYILGGPTQYLRLIHPLVANWYGLVTIFLFASWSGLQANTLAEILELENIPASLTGAVLALLLIFVLFGGAKRVGSLASKLVPIMFVCYITFSMFILFRDMGALHNAMILVFRNIFSPASAVGGFAGATILNAIQAGTYKAAYITEAGVGTSSIPHAISDVKRASDQGILALYSMVADSLLCVISGLLVLVTGVWKGGICLTSTLVYTVFRDHSPWVGKWILLLSITLFVVTTVIGNAFNGAQSFGSFTRHRWIRLYFVFVAAVTFWGAVSPVPTIWKGMELLLVFVALPNLIGLLILAFRHTNELKKA